jgi:hypothetical protein
MTPIEAAILVSGIGWLVSVVSSIAIVSFRGGRLVEKLSDIEKKQESQVTTTDMHSLDLRLSRIEGMFELTLKRSPPE